MDRDRIAYLVERYIGDAATEQELRELECLLANSEASPILEEILYESYHGLPDVAVLCPDREAKERIFRQIVAHPQSRSVPQSGKLKKWMPYAAAAILLASAGLLLWKSEGPESHREISATEVYPAAGGVVLSLADGRTIALDSRQEGITVGTEAISYDSGGTPVVQFGDETAPVEQLVLSTPKGSTYAVTLPDGSKVWLNAATKLRYPSRFAGTERRVHLEDGEAYFSVSKGRIPFKVASKGQLVEVLGTAFNVSAYGDDGESRTTLVEGSLRITARAGDVLLRPGQQAVNRGDALEVRPVDPTPFIAWKDGLFYFERTSPQDAIAQLARWYDLGVVYEGKVSAEGIFGSIDRKKPLASVLKAFEKSGLRFKVVRADERNQLIVLGE